MSLPYKLGSTAGLPRRSVLGLASPLRVAFNHNYELSQPQAMQKRGNRNHAKRMTRDMYKQMSRNVKEVGMSQAQKEAAATEYQSGNMPIFPSTFISLPVSQYPGGTDFFVYQWQRIKGYMTAKFSSLGVKLESMGKSWTTRPRLKLRAGKIAPTGKIMYRELMEAFAAGDKTTIRRLCTPAFADKFIVGIEKRSPREQLHFEMRNDSSLFNPKLMSQMLTDGTMYKKNTRLEQAVVRISSKQKVWKTNKQTGEVIPGSIKEQDRTEHVVMWRAWSTETWTATPWVLWGTTKPVTLEKVRQELKYYEEQQAKMAGWKIK